MSFIPELQRRNVIRVATAYIVAAWLIIQVIETTFPVFGLSDSAIRIVIIILGIGFTPVVIGAWVFQFTVHAGWPNARQGCRRDAGRLETCGPQS